MKTVIITADRPEHRFVTKYLVEALGDHLSSVVIERGAKKKLSLTSLKKATRQYNLFTLIERIITNLIRKLLRVEHRRLAALYKVLGQVSLKTYMSDELPILEVESANRDECIKWIEEIKPDYIFIYGTGIIGKKVLSLPSLQALNLHTGISPFYRGSNCAFWPLYNKEPLMVGSTVHKCTPEVDGGEIYGRVSVRLSENDDPYLAFAKAVEAGAVLYSNIAKRLVNGEVIPSKNQDFSLGREYRSKDKTYVQEIIMEYRISTGMLKKIIASAKDASLPYSESEVKDYLYVEKTSNTLY